jgi:hypothetical protein
MSSPRRFMIRRASNIGSARNLFNRCALVATKSGLAFMVAMRVLLRSLWATANFGSLWRATIRALLAALLAAVAASRRAANSGLALSEAIRAACAALRSGVHAMLGNRSEAVDDLALPIQDIP